MEFKRFPENDPFAVVDGIRYTIRPQGGVLVGTARVAARHLAAESAERIVTLCEETEAAIVEQLDAYAATLREEAEAAVPQAMAMAMAEAEATDAELVLALMRIRIRDEAAWTAICTGLVDDRRLSRRRADWNRPPRQITDEERRHLAAAILNAVEAVRPEDPEEVAAWADIY